MNEKKELVIFETEDKEIKLKVPIEDETVWLTQEQMSELFDTARSSIAYHIGNIFKEEGLDKNTSVEIFDRSTNAFRPPKYYNLDVIISVGYRVKSKRGVEFRKWANSVLKQYILKGYAVNHNRIAQLGEVIQKYSEALDLLDSYDHTLVALTIMIAESKPKEKEMIITVITNCLQ